MKYLSEHPIKYHLYILGAGATMSIYPKINSLDEWNKGAPSTADLMEGIINIDDQAFRDPSINSSYTKRNFYESTDIIKKFCMKYQLTSPNIEDVLTFLDISLTNEEIAKNPVIIKELGQVKDAITYLISILLVLRLRNYNERLKVILRIICGMKIRS